MSGLARIWRQWTPLLLSYGWIDFKVVNVTRVATRAAPLKKWLPRRFDDGRERFFPFLWPRLYGVIFSREKQKARKKKYCYPTSSTYFNIIYRLDTITTYYLLLTTTTTNTTIATAAAATAAAAIIVMIMIIIKQLLLPLSSCRHYYCA